MSSVPRTLAQAFDPDTIGFVEAHGTGTRLGDPIEVAALTAAFRERTNRRQFCALGSVKGNVGHLDTAAGMAGLVKAILAIERGAIPPTANVTRPNPALNLETSPFYVNAQMVDWSSDGPRRAGVSSLGAGGTNAHLVLEQAPANHRVEQEVERPAHVLALSARTDGALADLVERYEAQLSRDPDISLADLSLHGQHRTPSFFLSHLVRRRQCPGAARRAGQRTARVARARARRVRTSEASQRTAPCVPVHRDGGVPS